MNIKQYIQNTQFLVIAGIVNQKNFDYALFENLGIIMMNSITTANKIYLNMHNIHFNIDQSMVLGDPLKFLQYSIWKEPKNKSTEVNSLECFNGIKKSLNCYIKVMLL